MSLNIVFFIILLAALCHASWSAIVKNSNNGLAMMAITSLIEIVVFLPLIFTVPLPSLNIWYFIIATTILHGFYRYSVVVSYQYGDLSLSIPSQEEDHVLLLDWSLYYLFKTILTLLELLELLSSVRGYL